MSSLAIDSQSLLVQFNQWGDRQRDAILIPFNSELSTQIDVGQGITFCEDFKRHMHTLCKETQHELASEAQCIATIVIAPFSLFAEIFRLCRGSINASKCLKNICVIPKHIIASIFKSALYCARAAHGIVSAASIGVGFFTWHAGERIVRLITKSPHTVLSNFPKTRNIVYDSLGITLLAAASIFIPIASIQMIALPIIIGSIYGTVNNQFTIRECPEYYTMGHYSDGTNLHGHAIKSNNLLIKPIVTGCYATTMVTKIAGVILAAVGTLPYTAAVLPVPLAGIMIAGVCAISLVVAHLFSSIIKKSIQEDLNAYARLIGIEWSEDNRSKTWHDLEKMRNERIEKKRSELSGMELQFFNRDLARLTQAIESNNYFRMPVKYLIGWHANSGRNAVGYIFAGVGTLAIVVSTIFLRIFVL